MTDADKRYWIRKFLDMRDGHRCAMQGPECRGVLIIDHRDGNRSNWTEDNLRWLCVGHNRRSEVREREKQMRDVVDYQQGSTEMQVNDFAEPGYRSWLAAYLTRFKFITKKEAIASGAEKCEVSVTTSRKYLDKLTSAEGPYYESKDTKWKVKVIRMRGSK